MDVAAGHQVVKAKSPSAIWVGAPADCDQPFGLIATPILGDRDQAVDGCYEYRWVICESAMPRPLQEGARHAWTEITHAQDTRLAAFTCRRHVQTEGCGQPIDRCDCVRRARRAGLSWPLPENLSDEALERILYPPPKVTEGSATAARLAAIHREQSRPGVTLQLLWEEHHSVYPDGYRYSSY